MALYQAALTKRVEKHRQKDSGMGLVDRSIEEALR